MNEISIKLELGSICDGCLSQDRRLRPLGALRELFNRIIKKDDKNHFQSVSRLHQINLCWECTSYLRNAQKFQQRVQNAQTLLQLTSQGISIKNSVQNISTLAQTFKDTYDYNIIYDENELKDFGDFVKTENDDKQHIVDFDIVKDEGGFSDFNNDSDDNDKFENDTKDPDVIIKTKSKKKKKRYMSTRRSYTVVNFRDSIKSKEIYTEVLNNGDVGYKCNLCKHVSASLTKLLRHLKVKHEKAVKCLLCDIICNYSHEYTAHHREYHRVFICDYCGVQKAQKFVLEQHIISKHTLPQCKICNITFKHHHVLLEHIRSQHTVQPSEASYCVECDFMFDNVKLYKRHFRRVVHRKPKDRRVACEICKKVFAKNWNLQKHIKRMHEAPHTYEFQCDQCDKSYVTAFRLRCHKSRVHLKIAPAKNFACDHCGRKFAERRVLDNHVRTHTGERPFACKLCSASFAQISALVTHASRRHHVKLSYTEHIPKSEPTLY